MSDGSSHSDVLHNPVTAEPRSLFDALRLALEEENGLLIVALYEMPESDLERLVDAAQLIDKEGQEVLEFLDQERKSQARDKYPPYIVPASYPG